MKKGSLRLRLFVAAAISIAAALSLTGFALVRLFEAQVRERVITGLENDLLQLAGSISVAEDGTISAGKALSDPRYQEPYGGRYWKIEFMPAPGQAAPESMQSPSLWDYDLDSANPIGPEGEALVFARRELSIDRNGKPLELTLIAAAHEQEVQRPIEELRDQLIVSLGIIGSILLLGAWLQVTVGLRPLQQLRQKLADIRTGQASRLSGPFPDEVSPLAGELNDVLDLRDQSLERARRRAGDLAHGLKTPLTVLSSIARDLRKDGRMQQADDIDEQSDAMLRHVERALARARLSSGKGHAATGLKPVVERVIKALERLPGGDDLDFDVHVLNDVTVPMEHGDLTELLGNLLDNSRKWAKAMVRVRYAPPCLVIEDDGPGVPDENLKTISERGRRLDESKQGSGLGLSIVEDIADIYGLTVTYGRSPLGGLMVEIRV
ncbi:sensor histidine kinase [Aestuariivirga sp.]|uniref:sensor histidine kinase n=1 Tax=Aestuariivirga sp. TaxID=2650926 RepID=UPI0035939992